MCVVFFSVDELWFHWLRVLVYLKFPVVSFWNLWGFGLVWLDYIAWQEDIGHLTMMLFTLHGLFYVIAWGNLLQEVNANGGVILFFVCCYIYIYIYIYTRVFLLRLYLCACLFSRREEAYIYNH